jgi:uncharacterized membrane protein
MFRTRTLSLLRHAVLVLAAVAVANVATAQNATTGASFGYVVGQGPITIFFGNTAGTDNERWYTTSLVQGKSYCIETLRANTDSTLVERIDVDLNIDLIAVASGLVIATYNGLDDDPDGGNNSRWSRGCLIPPATQQYYIRLYKCVCATGRTGLVQFRISETSLYSPWWYVNAGAGYNAFIEIANTIASPVDAVVTLRNPAGTTLGTRSLSIAGYGNALLSAAADFGTVIPAGTGSTQISHNGPPGAITANATTLSVNQAISFDSPFTVRSGLR